MFNAIGADMGVPSVYEGSKGDNRYTIDIRHLPQGIYFARILMDGALTSTRRFMVAR